MASHAVGFLTLVGLSGGGAAAEFTPVSQLRAVQSDTVDSATGYTCLSGILPACPVDLGTSTPTASDSASSFGPWSATAATLGGSTSQTSIIHSSVVSAAGSSVSDAAANEIADSGYFLVLQTIDPSTSDDLEVTVDLDEAAEFSFAATGQIVYPDPGFPLTWDAGLDVQFTGPSGTLASLQAAVDLSCTPDTEFRCTVAPSPVSLTGVLPAGTYTVDIELTTSAEGGWLPSAGAVAAVASGSYEVSLELTPSASVPALSPPALVLLALGLGLAGLRLGRRLYQSQ